jgi:hypothetical protein
VKILSIQTAEVFSNFLAYLGVSIGVSPASALHPSIPAGTGTLGPPLKKNGKVPFLSPKLKR